MPIAEDRPLAALILGSANTLHDDRGVAEQLLEGLEHFVIACNHAGRDEPGRLDHWATMHPDLMSMWLKHRRAAGRPEPGRLWHAAHRGRSPEGSQAIQSWGGSSGLLCVAVAFELGCDRIILAGVPMLKAACHYDDPKQWLEARQYYRMWENHAPKMEGRVKSLSGWTRDLLGSPTREWARGGG